jgi:hypothetical protein
MRRVNMSLIEIMLMSGGLVTSSMSFMDAISADLHTSLASDGSNYVRRAVASMRFRSLFSLTP